MAYTEKVSISGTALSFLLYECANSGSAQEGFLFGDITSEITNHISDSNSDTTRLDTQIEIRTVLPLPSVSFFYQPTGKIKEEVLSDILSSSASEIVGWYKFRRNSTIKPTFRDKLISKGLQKYFDKHHGKKHFVVCNLSNKTSASGSTHTFTYRFGKINCFNMYEYVEDVTANLGEKLTGYKKAHRRSPNEIFKTIISESNVQNRNSSDAILQIQESVNVRLKKEAEIAANYESSVRELEAEISQMITILSDSQIEQLQLAHKQMLQERVANDKLELAQACVEALKAPVEKNNIKMPKLLIEANNVTVADNDLLIHTDNNSDRSASPVLVPKKTSFNYAAALKKKNDGAVASSSKPKDENEDLIKFDVEDVNVMKKPFINNVGARNSRDSSPDY